MKKNTDSQIRVMIADDHGIVRQGIEKVLSKAPDIVVAAEAESGTEVLEKIREVDLDMLVMDIEMPGKNGWDVLMELKQIRPKLPVIVLSIYPEEHYGPRFLKAGAAGYINKKDAVTDLIPAIRKVANGGRHVSPPLAEQIIEHMGKPASDDQLHETLSDREFQVFQLIAAGKKLSEIAKTLHISIPTVSTHRARILEKMGMKSNAELIYYAVKHHLIG